MQLITYFILLLHVTRIVKTLTKLFTGQPSLLTADSKRTMALMMKATTIIVTFFLIDFTFIHPSIYT
jgi:hypothetical protein